MANKKKIVMMLCILFQRINIYDQSVAMADIGLLVGGGGVSVIRSHNVLTNRAGGGGGTGRNVSLYLQKG